ncbi:acyl carrier protein [Streptomyces cyanogenus]|uniref:Tyrocidine synthase 3 n=1 Tax=Streptomyces cyanogenus TaxID=80860 RepID=A0ABX7TVJ7_STRCY|nr:acyl carrier protein [Streptomyces cyanogenus]QTD99688.1 Tyrocidine synthase 3 [Streptomyces cyanogenus]
MTQTHTLPTTPAEYQAVVRQTWEHVLGHPEFGDEDPFLSVHGANSLTAVQVMVALSGRLGTRLPVRLIMRHRTVQDLAAAIREQADA